MPAAVYSTPEYYKNKIPLPVAQQYAGQLGITPDQLYNYFAQAGDPNVYSMSPLQGAAANQGYGGMGASQPQLKTSGIMPFVAAGKAAPQAGAGTPAAQPGATSYWGQNPTISMGDGSIGGGTGAGAGGGANTIMANGQQPESVALAQMAQIDPASEALRQGLAQSYLTPLQQAGTPTAQQFQDQLNLYGQIDPTGLASRTQLGQDLASQEALGSQLDPTTMRQLEQSVREAQAARGNVYGTPQLVQEAMTTGQAGLALQQQRQQALQSYLQSGQTPGDVALNLYNMQQANLRASQSAAGGYLTSGATPYAAGASYLNTAENRAQAAAQGGPVYNPQGPGGYYTGAGTSSFPQYGLDMSQLANQWYGQMNAYNLQAASLGQSAGPSAGAKAASGALSGAASGALAGSAVPGLGTVAGGLIGAIGGGLGGYFS
jgi:hypothetical protein